MGSHWKSIFSFFTSLLTTMLGGVGWWKVFVIVYWIFIRITPFCLIQSIKWKIYFRFKISESKRWVRKLFHLVFVINSELEQLKGKKNIKRKWNFNVEFITVISILVRMKELLIFMWTGFPNSSIASATNQDNENIFRIQWSRRWNSISMMLKQ